MTSIAITMMIVALLVIWGGLIFSLIRLPKEEKKIKNSPHFKKRGGRGAPPLFCYFDKSI